jgi:hypothetical protein
MKSAAERFYESSHEANARRQTAPPPTVEELTATVSAVGQRYFPVMKYLRENPGLDAVELGFGAR